MTRARRRFEQRTGIDTRGLDRRQARRLMRRWSPEWLAYRLTRERVTWPGLTTPGDPS